MNSPTIFTLVGSESPGLPSFILYSSGNKIITQHLYILLFIHDFDLQGTMLPTHWVVAFAHLKMMVRA